MMKKFKNTPTKREALKAQPAMAQAVKSETVTIITAKNEVSKAGRVAFELVKPDAKNVCVAGTFNDWKPEKAPLVPMGNGRWAGDLSVKPGKYEYLFVVDGQWMPDPNAKESVENPFGGRNSVIGVSE
jgi:1,4-alpha-glucan branching enzyme